MNLREQLESHAAECRAARREGRERPSLPQDVRDYLAMDRAETVSCDDADLRGSAFDLVTVRRVRFDGSIFDGSSFVGSRFDGSRFDGSSFVGSRFYRCVNPPTLAGNGCPPETVEQRAKRRAEVAVAFRAERPDVPVVPDLDRAILAAVSREGCSLNMGEWHTCATTHCRAGWAITLAGEAGKALESRVGSPSAGSLIYLASVGYVPNFYSDDGDAMADMREAVEGA